MVCLEVRGQHNMAQAITIETAVTESYSASSPTSPVTMSMTVPAGLSNAILIVQLGFAHNSMTLGTPTYNGGNMTLGRTDDQSTTTKNSIWYTLNPASGTNTISVPWTGNVTQSHIGAIVIANAVQAAPLVGGNNGSLQSTATCNTTITGQSYLIIDGITPNATITAASAQTVLLNTTSTFVRE